VFRQLPLQYVCRAGHHTEEEGQDDDGRTEDAKKGHEVDIECDDDEEEEEESKYSDELVGLAGKYCEDDTRYDDESDMETWFDELTIEDLEIEEELEVKHGKLLDDASCEDGFTVRVADRLLSTRLLIGEDPER
jgi:hypothetical protein